MGLAEVKWPKSGLAVLFLVDGAGFGTWAAHVPVFKQVLHIENGSLTFVLISVIAGAAGLMLQRQGTVRSDLSFTAGVLGLCCILTLPMLVDEAVRPRAASKVVIGSLAVMVGLRQAMGVIVLCGIIVAVGPFFFPLQSTSRSSNEEVVTTGA